MFEKIRFCCVILLLFGCWYFTNTRLLQTQKLKTLLPIFDMHIKKGFCKKNLSTHLRKKSFDMLAGKIPGTQLQHSPITIGGLAHKSRVHKYTPVTKIFFFLSKSDRQTSLVCSSNHTALYGTLNLVIQYIDIKIL